MSTVILVPVKDPAKAKARMAPILTAEERSLLAQTMFEDLAEALCAPPERHVVLVTNSETASERARSLGWRVLWEEEQISESNSVDRASALLAREGVAAALRVPADVPLIRAQDIDELLSIVPDATSALLVPSWDRTGTNALLRRPPDLFPSRFGPNSLVLHTQEAWRAQVRLAIVENERIALDLDDAADILRFTELDSETRTGRLLQKLRIAERIVQNVL